MAESEAKETEIKEAILEFKQGMTF